MIKIQDGVQKPLKNGATPKSQMSRKDIKNKMIKYLAFIFFAIITTVTFAQSKAKLKNKEIARISYVVKGGLNLSSVLLKGDESSGVDVKSKPGYHVGITAEYPVSEIFVFETGILLSNKGFKGSSENTHGGDLYKYNSTINLLYVEIPLTAKTYFNVGQSKIFGALGPYIGLGLSGKSKGEVIFRGETNSIEHDINWGSSQGDDFKRLDYGLTAGAGIEISSIQIGLCYNLGLANISTITDNGLKIRNRVFGLSVGYKFRRK